MNEYDSNRIYDLTSVIDFEKTDIKKEADCFVLNTCHIREKATEKVYDEIGRVKKDFKNLKMSVDIESKCKQKGVRLTDQRKLIAKIMSDSASHPDVDELHKKVSKFDSKISIATVYRTVKLFEEAGIVSKHDFRGYKSRYEQVPEEHHDHLIDINSGEITEFVNEEIEKLQKQVAEKLGYKLVDHRLELYGSKIKK